jgi:DNA-binding NtrC family response regulator
MDTEKAVIIAEPSETLMTGLRPFLDENDLRVIHVRTQKEALLTLQNQRVHAMVLDADLLEEDCEFISLIKGMQGNLPVIVCAEVNTPEFETRVRQKRIFYYHIKSFGNEDLEMALSNAILKVSHDLGGSPYGHR